METVSVALLQLPAHDRNDFPQAWSRVLARVHEAAAQHTNVIVLPEGTVPGYVIGYDPLDPLVIERAIADLQHIADSQNCVIVAGIAELTATGTYGVRNSAIVLCPHMPAQYTSKRFLWHFDSKWFDPGEDIVPVNTPFGTFGIIVCADGRIPTIAATLVDRGAQLLIIITAWVTSGRDQHVLENMQADLLARVRAWENATPIVVANKVGCEYESVLYCGKSQAISADGTILAIASQDRTETLNVTIPLQAPHRRNAVQPLAVTPSAASASRALRVAVTQHLTQRRYDVASWSDVDVLLCTTTDRIEPTSTRIAALGASEISRAVLLEGMHALVLTDDTITEPTYLPIARQAGYDVVVWYPQQIATQWIIPLARTRAVELRAYVIVMQADGHIHIVDPQGIIVAGTTSELYVAQFVYDPHISQTTTIVPNTDIVQGMIRMGQLH